MLRPEQLARLTRLERYAAEGALAGYVENLWSLRWDLPHGTHHPSQTLPHPACTVSVERGATRAGVGGDPVVVTGVVTRRFDVDLTGHGWVFAAKFRPGGLAALTGGHAVRWRDRTLPAREVLPAGVVATLAELGPDVPDDECRAVLGVALAQVVPEQPDAAYDLVLRVVGDMLADRSLLSVAEVEERHGLGTRRLQRLFARYVGATPKWVLARYRMHDAVAALDAGYDGSLADLAA
ncbi:helix-turn-helix domain-containing protein [Nocardioides aestuarii]